MKAKPGRCRKTVQPFRLDEVDDDPSAKPRPAHRCGAVASHNRLSRCSAEGTSMSVPLRVGTRKNFALPAIEESTALDQARVCWIGGGNYGQMTHSLPRITTSAVLSGGAPRRL